jgi:hypothetical protein
MSLNDNEIKRKNKVGKVGNVYVPKKADLLNNKLISNQIKRKNKRDRVRLRKLNGTYVHKKADIVINKWGKPYYEKVRVETPWKKCVRHRSRYNFWLNTLTGEIIESYDLVGEPSAHIHYKYESTGPFAIIKNELKKEDIVE